MRRLFQVMIVATILTGCAFGVHTQKAPQRTSSGRAAYGNAVHEFKANKKKNQKAKKKALKSARRKKSGNNRSSYFEGRPY